MVQNIGIGLVIMVVFQIMVCIMTAVIEIIGNK